MKIILLILLSACTLLAAEYPRYKLRGPPYPPRAPNHQDFPNKRHQQYPQRGPPKGSKPPMPHLMHNYHKGPMGVPMGIPQAPPRPVSLPLRTFWKNGHVPMKFPQPEKVFLQQQLQQAQLQQGQLQQVHQEKPFLSSPSISAQEYDYQIQTNNIPTSYVNPIKQIGEKGPIHTIPAPNLSPKDKPFIIEEARNEIYQQPFVIEEIRNEIQQQQQQQHQQQHQQQYQQQHQQQQQLQQLQQHHQQQLQQQQQQQQHQQHQQQQQTAQYLKVEQSHQYQVTEQPEPSSNQNSYRLQQQNQINQYQVQQLQQQQQEHQQQQQQLQQESLRQFQQQHFTPDTQEQNNKQFPQGDIILGNNLSPQDLYKLIATAYPQQQDPESSDHQQLFHPEPINVEQLQQDVASQLTSNKITFQPEFQSFNYDEQAHQKSLTKSELSSLVSAAYNLDPSAEAPEDADQEPEAHSQQVVQNYFEKRSDVGETEPEPAKQLDKKLPSYYSSLPNKEAAEKLAQLQAAGKINSNLMKIGSIMSKSKEPMAIFIPDETVGGKDKLEEDDIRGDSEERSVEYDDYSQEEIASEEENEGYGHKLQPKKFD